MAGISFQILNHWWCIMSLNPREIREDYSKREMGIYLCKINLVSEPLKRRDVWGVFQPNDHLNGFCLLAECKHHFKFPATDL